MSVIFISVALGLACGGYFGIPYLYDMHPALGISIGMLTYLVTPETDPYVKRFFQMYITISQEQEKLLLAILAKLGGDVPPEDDREDPEDYRS